MQSKIYPLNTNYLIYENGDIINITTKRKLKPSKQIIKGKETGYIYVTLLSGSSKNWSYNRISLHRILGITFIDNPNNKPWINHKDRNRSNNELSNLEWSTIAENIQHSYDNGRETKKGAEHWKFGTKTSEEAKIKMSNAVRNYKHPRYNTNKH